MKAALRWDLSGGSALQSGQESRCLRCCQPRQVQQRRWLSPGTIGVSQLRQRWVVFFPTLEGERSRDLSMLRAVSQTKRRVVINLELREEKGVVVHGVDYI